MTIRFVLHLLSLFLILCSSSVLAQDADLIEPKKLLKDFDVVLEMISAHPDPYTHIPEAVFNRKVDSIKASINQPLTALDFYKKTAFVIALLRDGHSAASLPTSWRIEMAETFGCFPYEMHLSNENELYVLKSLNGGDIQPGAKIISINGISVDKFLASIDPYISYEKESFRNTIIDNDFGLYLYLAFDKSHDLLIKSFRTDTLETVVKNMPYKDWLRLQKNEREEREILISKGKPYAYEKLDDGVGLLHVYGFSTDNLIAYESFLSKTFKSIEKDSIHSLIIDIRGNYGGWPKIASELFHYITDSYFKTMAKSNAKVSYPYQRFYYEKFPYLRTNRPNITERPHFVDLYSILSKDHGEFVEEAELFNEKPITKNAEFRGDLYLLTNRDSYSAASSFASTFQCYSMGYIIGEETGGTKIFRANPIYITLKRSGIELAMSTTKLFTTCYSEEFMGINPNIEYSPSIMELLSDLDTQLIYTQRLIRKARKQSRLKVEQNSN